MSEDEKLIFLSPPEMSTSLSEVPTGPSTKDRFYTKMKENPLIPAGFMLTVFALTNGMRHWFYSDHIKQQKMMRLRVGAQGFTVLAIVGGVMFTATTDKMLSD